jgi:hypothetical protein
MIAFLASAPVDAQIQLRAPNPLQANSPKSTKAQRVTQLQTALSNEDQLIDILESETPSASSKAHRQTTVETVTKARDATQRLINDVEGKEVDTGVAEAHSRDRIAAKKAQPAADRYAALAQARSLLDQASTILTQDPGAKNNHRTNALKFLQQANAPLQSEVEAYAAAHPEVQTAQAQAQAQAQAAQAQPAAAPMPAQTANPSAGTVPLTSPKRLEDLRNVIPHIEHSIDMTNAQPDDGQNHRQKTLDALVRARDTVRQMISQTQNESPADLAKEVQSDHARDALKQNLNNQNGYPALQRIQGYMHNDRVVIERQADDPARLRTSALDAIDQANAAVLQQVNDYQRAHPNEKH